MSYQYVEFDGVSLPLLDHNQDHDFMGMSSAALRSIGGAVDYFGANVGTHQPRTLDLRGLYIGERAYIVDEDCDRLVDENGDAIIGGTAEDMLLADIQTLAAKIRSRGRLTRERLSDGYREWKNARFLAMQWPRKWQDHAIIAELRCVFEVLDAGWHSELATVASRTLPSGEAKPLTVQNGGNMTVTDAIITIYITSGTITQVDIDGTGIDLRWTGSITTGPLIINCGASTITNAGSNAYVTTFRQSGHTAKTWLPLAVGSTDLTVTVTGGNGYITIEHYAQNP